MPRYWSDDIAKVLLETQRIHDDLAASLVAMPVAFRSNAPTIEEAVDVLLEDDEIPLAA